MFVLILVSSSSVKSTAFSPKYLDSYVDLFRASLHEVLPKPLTPVT
jgi:hypothetical protein